MKTLVTVSLSLAMGTLFGFSAQAQNVSKSPVVAPIISKLPASKLGTYSGTWEGTLRTGSNTHRVALDVAARPESNTITADMTTSAQSPFIVLVDTFDIQDHQVHLTMATAGTSFEGVSNQNLTEIRGTWNQNGKMYPLVLHRVEMEPKNVMRGKQQQPMPMDNAKSSDETTEAPRASHKSPFFFIGPPRWYEWYVWTPPIGGQERPYGMDYW